MGESSSPLPQAGEVGGGPALTSNVPLVESACPPLNLLPQAGGEGNHNAPVPLAAFLDSQTNATAVRLEAGDDARALLPYLDRIALVEVSFPTFRDGRGYSTARVLREAGYTGTLRAQGDVLVDQMPLMKRCGFDSFAPQSEIDSVTLEASLARYDNVYQKAADGRVPVWKLRHG